MQPLIDNQYKNVSYGVMEEDRDKDQINKD